MIYFDLSLAVVIICVSLSVIIYCHIFVYLVTRRRMIQIQAEQVSQDAKLKFLEEKKAAKTTSIIIACVFFSFVRMLIYRLEHFLLRTILQAYLLVPNLFCNLAI